jgi:hypothetical protein
MKAVFVELATDGQVIIDQGGQNGAYENNDYAKQCHRLYIPKSALIISSSHIHSGRDRSHMKFLLHAFNLCMY